MRVLLKEKTKKIFKTSVFDKFSKSKLIKAITPKETTEEYKLSSMKLKKLGKKYKPERVNAYRVIVFISSFILLVILANIAVYEKQNDIINDFFSSTNSFSINLLTNNDALKEGEVVRYILNNYKREFNAAMKDEDKDAVYELFKEADEDLNIKINKKMETNIYKKLNKIYKNKISVIGYIFIIIISVLSTSLVQLYYKIIGIIRENKIDKEFEIMKLITIMNVKNKDIQVEEILKRQQSHAKYLYPYYEKCLRTYKTNPDIAIKELIEDVNHDDFEQFMLFIYQMLTSDSNTNIKLLENEKNISFLLESELHAEKVNKIAHMFTFLSFPSWAMTILIIFVPVLICASSQL